MEIIQNYKAAKQNNALLKIFSEGFPGNLEVTQGLEDLLNKNESTIQRLLSKWNNRKQPVHTAQSIFLLCAQDLQERKRDELLNQAVNYADPRNQVNKGRSKWTGFDPTTVEYFNDPIELGVEVRWDD